MLIGDYTYYTGAIASVVTCVSTLISSTGTVYEGTLFIDNLIAFFNEKQHIVPKQIPGRRWKRAASIPLNLWM